MAQHAFGNTTITTEVMNPAEVKVMIGETVLCWVSIDDIENLVKELDEVVSKYRI